MSQPIKISFTDLAQILFVIFVHLIYKVHTNKYKKTCCIWAAWTERGLRRFLSWSKFQLKRRQCINWMEI